MQSIEELWTPNFDTGFLPRLAPLSPSDIASRPEPLCQHLGYAAPRVDSMSDQELEDFVVQLGTPGNEIPEDCAPELSEALVRACVNVAAHLIHRPFFAARKRLPSAIARPLWTLSKIVGRPPSLTYASYVLANFTNPFPESRTGPNDLIIAQTPTGTSDEEWFVAVHLSIESAGGEIVRAIHLIESALSEKDHAPILPAVEMIHSCLTFSIEVLPRIVEHLKADIFRERIRPLLYGHDRITFSGVEGEPQVTYIGETGAQSGIIRAIDSILGVSHSTSMTASIGHFLECAPKPHQSYFRTAETVGRRLSEEVQLRSVLEARRDALHALAEFRRTHLRIVSGYLMRDGKQLSDRGTGGTNFRDWLQTLIDEAEAAAKT